MWTPAHLSDFGLLLSGAESGPKDEAWLLELLRAEVELRYGEGLAAYVFKTARTCRREIRCRRFQNTPPLSLSRSVRAFPAGNCKRVFAGSTAVVTGRDETSVQWCCPTRTVKVFLNRSSAKMSGQSDGAIDFTSGDARSRLVSAQ